MKTFKNDLAPTTDSTCPSVMHITAINSIANHTTQCSQHSVLMKIIITFGNITTSTVNNPITSIMRTEIIILIMNQFWYLHSESNVLLKVRLTNALWYKLQNCIYYLKYWSWQGIHTLSYCTAEALNFINNNMLKIQVQNLIDTGLACNFVGNMWRQTRHNTRGNK
jgi:hypothetical protein